MSFCDEKLPIPHSTSIPSDLEEKVIQSNLIEKPATENSKKPPASIEEKPKK
tara:strand:- start:237 stop:392 length:156 start_codon:yes stop_codon:yes gene_type:complete